MDLDESANGVAQPPAPAVTVLFAGADMPAPVPVLAQAGEPLLDLVRRAAIPLHWHCGHGTCGTCAVHLQYPAGHAPTVMLRRKERNVLARAGKFTPDQQQQEQHPQTPDLWRLGCYVVAEAGLQVSW
jgi:ferredoxin